MTVTAATALKRKREKKKRKEKEGKGREEKRRDSNTTAFFIFSLQQGPGATGREVVQPARGVPPLGGGYKKRE